MIHRGRWLFAAGALTALAAGWGGFPQVIYERRAQPVEFSHKVHTGGAGMKCADCHEFRADGSFSGIPRLAKCVECHTAAMGTSAAEKNFIAQYVTPGREVAWQVNARQPENVYFSHATHVKLAGLSCGTCHAGQGDSNAPQPYEEDRISGYTRETWNRMKMDDCAGCHRQRHLAEQSCLDCHK
ncbi:MAG TPA: menaquinone reductase multiheme cytochrome c subunit QrcA [Bryobacteraceae bacterium]|nr:menaquinone reductase multiheme cytochrome c subunit QrcA [Bryobacteraceae bacterium]